MLSYEKYNEALSVRHHVVNQSNYINYTKYLAEVDCLCRTVDCLCRTVNCLCRTVDCLCRTVNCLCRTVNCLCRTVDCLSLQWPSSLLLSFETLLECLANDVLSRQTCPNHLSLLCLMTSVMDSGVKLSPPMQLFYNLSALITPPIAYIQRIA